MLKNISNLGSVLSKTDQKSVNGGRQSLSNEGSFACYCDGVYHCEADSIQDCLTECGL